MSREQPSQEKRARPNQSASDPSTAGAAFLSGGSDQPQPPQPQQLLQRPQPSEPVQVPSAFVRSDVGTYSNDRLRGLSDEDRLWLLQNACRPDANYKYPQKEEYSKKRSFQHSFSMVVLF